ncbi:MAG: hypothetical protein HOI23_10195 [Deltaproteobacteria bacterium]|jgi:hypothetical protein|nr:hypothetical protein [Deltaproteobacteria bacterium]MBT6435698.1 hypothetical protein [Deltaproteobacteria bacterium]
MSTITEGIKAGFIGTVAMSAIMFAKDMMGVMPELNVIHMLANMMGMSVLMGWVMHFMIGSLVWGVGFTIIYTLLPGKSATTKGISFGVLAWLGMMVMVMPMAGAGLFGLNMGIVAPMMTLMLHIVFGWVMGRVFTSQSIADDSEPKTV